MERQPGTVLAPVFEPGVAFSLGSEDIPSAKKRVSGAAPDGQIFAFVSDSVEFAQADREMAGWDARGWGRVVR